MLDFTTSTALPEPIEYVAPVPTGPFLVAYRTNDGFEVKTRAFAALEEAERYYKWCNQIGFGAAVYDNSLARLHYKDTELYPFEYYDRYVANELVAAAWTPI